MLRNRSRAVTSKQAIMADHTPLCNQKHTTPTSSFLNSPRFFNGLVTKNLSDAENVSPTSILESKQHFLKANPFGYDKSMLNTPITSTENKQIYEKLDSEGIGLAIIDSINDEDNNFSMPSSKKMVLFGAKLKVQVPSLPASSSAFSSSDQSPKSPADFGIKTLSSHILSPFWSENCGNQSKTPQAFNGKLSLREMEMSEDYTCVITHGPNPKTIHIFDNCIVDSCCGFVGMSELKKEHSCSTDDSSSESLDFLSFCHTCKNNLQEGKDIYMYRGEKAFCSNECRSQEILSEEKKYLKLSRTMI